MITHSYSPFPDIARIAGWVVLWGAGLTPVHGWGEEFRWELQAGDSFEVRMEHEIQQSVRVQGRELQLPSSLALNTTWTVQEVDDEGTATFRQTIDRVTIEREIPGEGTIAWDSSGDSSDLSLSSSSLANLWSPLVGGTFLQRMDPRGRILETQLGSFPEGRPSPEVRDLLRGISAKTVVAFADGQVETGDSWEDAVTYQTSLGSMTLNRTWSYEGVESVDGRELDRFPWTFEIEPGGRRGWGERTLLSQQSDGVSLFDRSNGHLVETRMNQQLVLETVDDDLQIRQELRVTTVVQWSALERAN